MINNDLTVYTFST